jgi:hypothetical protein
MFALQLSALATSYYVAPTGTAASTGSLTSPWDLQTALNQPTAVKAGDTIWLRGGRYQGVFVANLTGTSTAPIVVRQYPGERAIVDNATDIYKSAFTVQGSYTWYWGFEIASSNTKRVSAQSGPWPTDVPNGSGLATANQGTGNKFINLIIHDNPFGMGIWNGATDIDTYGCLVYYNGWKGTDRPHGHGIYAQNTQPSVKRVHDSFMYYNADHGAQFYGSSTAPIDNFDLQGNVIFNNSALFADTLSGRNLLVGGGATANNPKIVSNYLYRASGANNPSSDFYLGYGTGSANAVLRDNYLVGNAMFSGSADVGLTSSGNLFYGALTSYSTAQYPANTYTTTRPTGVKVSVRPNQYEPGRANIAIYNWNLANTVSVDVTGVGLSVGDTYELRNAMDYFGDVITATYAGGPIIVPMTGHTIAAPSGLPAPVSPFPEFGAFVLIKKSSGTSSNTAPTISTVPNQSINANTATSPLAFTVGDAQTAAGSLTVTASSSNATLVPAASVVLAGTTASRTVTVTPAANQTGTATITLTVSDGTATTSTSFTLTVNAVNTAPTISTIPNQSINANTSTGPVAFTVGDTQTAAGSLTVTAGSSNTTLVPSGNIALGGTSASRTVTVTPAANQTGTTTITLTVSDGSLTASTSFTLTVNAVVIANSAPTISSIANRSVNVSTSTGPIAFTIGDSQTAAGSLTLSRSSSNTTLVPTSSIVFGGSGANRTVTVTPATGKTGTATVTITVSDGSLTAKTSFTLTVSIVNTAPTISSIANRSVNANTSTGPIAFTVGDGQTAAGSLTATARSSNSALVPSTGISLGGTSASRTVTVTPATGQAGTATITITVSDGSLTASTSFTLTVIGTSSASTSGNTLPTITPLADQIVSVGVSTGPLAVTVGDTETAAGSLTVTAISSNPTLVPSSGIVVGGSGASRTVTVSPAAGQTGTTSILVTVNDGTAIASTSFALTVNPALALVYLTVEAESGTLVAPMAMTTNTLASGGAYVSSPIASSGSVTYNVNIPATDTYVVWCRVLAADATSDSFTVLVDGTAADTFDAAENTWSPQSQWTVLNGRGGTTTPATLNPRTLALSKGAHTITFQGRDPNTVLDRLIITNDKLIGITE